MKKATLLIILIICAALLAALYFAVLKPRKEAEEKAGADTGSEVETFTVHSYGDAPSGIAYTLDDGTEISFSCREGVWYYDGDAEFPVTQATLNETAKNLAVIKATRAIETVDAETAESYGLTDASRTVKLTSADGVTDTYKIGAFLLADEYCYVENDGKIYVCESVIADSTVKKLFDYLTRGSIELSTRISKVVLDGKEKDCDLKKVCDVYNQIVLTDIADYKNKEKYGFDGTQHIITVTHAIPADVTNEAGINVSTTVRDSDFTIEAAFDAEGNSYVMIPGDPLIYTSNVDMLLGEIEK